MLRGIGIFAVLAIVGVAFALPKGITKTSDVLLEEGSKTPAQTVGPVAWQAVRSDEDGAPLQGPCKDAPDFNWAIILQLFLGWTGFGFAYINQWGLFTLTMFSLIPMCLIVGLYYLSKSYTFKDTHEGGYGVEKKVVNGEATGWTPFVIGLVTCGSCFLLFTLGLWLFGVIAMSAGTLPAGDGCPLANLD